MKRALTSLILLVSSIAAFGQPATAAKTALIIDAETHDVLYQKNLEVVRPIASLTKLMTALVIVDAGLPLDEVIMISTQDAKAARPTGGHLRVGVSLTRGELLHLTLMSSQNRAAAALGRTYPGGMQAFVEAMNQKAVELGMTNSAFTDPTGLYNTNVSTANDIVKLTAAAYAHDVIRHYSITPSHTITTMGRRVHKFNTTNGLIKRPDWDILLQKTGYIADAGRCVVIVTTMAARQVVMVLLNAPSSPARQRDAVRLRQWIERQQPTPLNTR